MILCDIGNSTYHFLQDDKKFKSNTKDDLPKLDKNKQIYFISVNEIACNKLLTNYPDAINIKNLFNFDTSFASTMGIDRVVACSFISNGIIVDSGSAITVDIMQNGIHIGGFIMPGIDKLKSIYPNISSKLAFNFENNINLDKIPLNTNDAINYALLKMIVLPIKETQKKYNLDITFTGENSKLIQQHFEKSSFNETLLFDSMKSVIRKIYDNNCFTKR